MADTYAAFDLDGTLTRRDTLLPFLFAARGRLRTVSALAVCSPLLARAAISGGEHRDVAKAAVIGRLLAGQPVDRLSDLAERFADAIVPAHLRPDIAARVAWHHDQGHTVVIVSASPELYVAPIARRLGVDTVLATRLEAGPDGRLTGRLVGRNCRGSEKVERLRSGLRGAGIAYAYGDSQGDAEMLASAGEGTYVRHRRGVWKRRSTSL